MLVKNVDVSTGEAVIRAGDVVFRLVKIGERKARVFISAPPGCHITHETVGHGSAVDMSTPNVVDEG